MLIHMGYSVSVETQFLSFKLPKEHSKKKKNNRQKKNKKKKEQQGKYREEQEANEYSCLLS